MRLHFAFCALALIGTASADTEGKIHPPTSPACATFKPHELCFETPKDEIARAEYHSQPFYAVMLKTGERCGITEKERLEAQALFPRNKVFSTRFGCGDDAEENINYTNVSEKFGFLAAYAGPTPEDAAKLMHDVQTSGRFPGANIRKMQAVLVYP